MGTPEFAVPALEALVAAGHDVAAVYTQPPRPANRGKALTPSPVHRRAEALGLDVRTPLNFKADEDRDAFAALGLEVAVVAAYGLILPQAILDAPKRGCLNIHASLLPRWRGAAPIHRAILAGDAETGITIMQMERGLDTGPMLLTRTTTVAAKTTSALTGELAWMGAELIVATLAHLPHLTATAQPEDGVTYAHKIDKAEAKLDFTQDASSVARAVLAFDPAPGAYAELGELRLKLFDPEVMDATGAPGTVIGDGLTIACASGAVRPRTVQPAGKPRMPVDAFLRGTPIAPGTRFG